MGEARNGGGGSRTRVHAGKPCASTGLVKRGICREKVAASQASFPYLEKSPAPHPRLKHSKSLSATEFSSIRNSMLEIPAQPLTRRVQTVRFQTVRLLHVLQLFFCQFEAPSRLPAAHGFSCLSKPVHPRKIRPACAGQNKSTVTAAFYSPSALMPWRFCWNRLSIATPFFLSL